MVGPGKRSEGGGGARRRALGAATACTLLAAVCGCGADAGEDRESRERTAVQHVLDRQAEAVRDGKESAYLAAVDPREDGYRGAQRQVFANLRRLPLTQWSYTVGDVRHTGGSAAGEEAAKRGEEAALQDEEAAKVGEKAQKERQGGSSSGGGLVADVRLRYKLRGDDQSPVSATERLSFAERGGKWYVSGELSGSDRQLWEQGEIGVARGKHSLVLGADRGSDELRALADDADRAVAEVDRAWPRAWPHRVVVESPSSLEDMARLLDAAPSTYEGIAAVTTGEAGEHTDAPADRIVVNPEAYGELSEEGRQVVVTHESVHVASRTHTSDATPLWLSEGFADWVAYGSTDRKPKEAAAELVRAAEEDRLPRELPTDRAFRFGSGSEALGRAYESGWLACRLIADEWGEEKLLGVYLRTGSSQKRQDAAVEEALRAELGVGRKEFTERWRSYVRRELT